MRDYMPPKHNQFIKNLESKSTTRDLIKDSSKLQKTYDDCLD